MKNLNVGIVNLIISTKLRESYFGDNNDLINESKSLISEFINTIKKSPILQLEFKVFDNIENKVIENELMATRYIDNNIKLFEIYTIDEIINERKKLEKFTNNNFSLLENKNYKNKIKLYNAIDVLINESLNDYDNIDVDNLHESFNFILNHIKKPKNNEIFNKNDNNIINEEVLEIAINKFNDKFGLLGENDKSILKTLIKSSNEDKFQLFETYKNETLTILENVNDSKSKNVIEKAINKINEEMSYNINSKEFLEKIDEDIVSLYELKNEIL